MDTGVILSYLPSAVISLLIVVFSLSAKKKSNRGALWIPMTCSLAVVLFELLLIAEVIIPPSRSDVAIIIKVAIFIAVIYALFRYYFSLYKTVQNSGM